MKDVPSSVTESFRRSYHGDVADATIRKWRNKIVSQLPELFELSSVLEKPLPEDQKIPIPDLDMLVTGSGPDDCTKDDARLLFRGGGGFSRLIPLYYTIVSSTPEANTEAGYHHFWDSNIRDLLLILLPQGRTSRNSSHGTQTAAFRPDFVFLYQNICPFRGEEKPPLSLDNPKVELSDKLFELWPYPEAPYVLGYHAKGPILTLAAIGPTESGQTVVTDLATYNLRRRKDRIKHMVALINMAPLLRHLADLVPAVDAEFTEIERSTCVVEILGPVVLKTFTGSLDIRQTRMDHLDKIYIILGQKSVPHTDKLLHFIPDEHKVILHPRGDARGPKTEDELLDAVICVLEMLEVLHKPPTFIHRDLRWPNIMRSLKDRRDWFVIDWTENKRNFDPRTHCPRLYLENHGTEVDLWSVGELVLTSKVYLISSWLTRFGCSLKETPVTAAEALREIQNLRDRHRLQNSGEVVQAPRSPQLGRSFW
ncbi:hypothetical protein GGX14DRAFT_431977 [Mycena pura]|uniref:Protein kinase domain-containing protein n=1 Tax=Mycena pura TaxID=153505 RepID=A0AAD6VV80_9AGAR|nr:hypothetical protein GGX14DRAFT_431977 [Mycena pura]